MNPGRRGEKPATNRFSYGAAKDATVVEIYMPFKCVMNHY
jgi:hypothetical protein